MECSTDIAIKNGQWTVFILSFFSLSTTQRAFTSQVSTDTFTQILSTKSQPAHQELMHTHSQ